MAAGDSTERATGTSARPGGAEMRLLATMPLHAITSVHGETGLRELLRARHPSQA